MCELDSIGHGIDKCCHICYNIFTVDRLPETIRHCRTAEGLTQEQLARSLGVSLNTVQRWEAGRSRPSPLAKEKLKHVLGGVLGREQLRML